VAFFVFSTLQLYQYIQFYKIFPISNALRSQFNWSQFRLLIKTENEDKRTFYITESIKNHWTSRQLELQINSHLYERLLLSNDKESVLAVAKGVKQPNEAREIIKDPMTLELLGF
jgi:predicted nuclease of restriction endonuclease-like (RecB) superfamily